MPGELDPDNNGLEFDDLDAAAKEKSPRAQLAALKAAGGGLKLAYKLMSEKLWRHAKILYIAQRACWTWYTEQVKRVKTPAQGMRDILASSQGAWMYDKHLRGIVWDCFASSSTFNFLQLEMGESVYSRRLAELAVSILGNRAWSLAVRNHAPPECYVGLLSKHVDKRQDAIEQMRSHWQKLISLEHRRHEYEPATVLWNDLLVCKRSPIRILYILFERDQWRADSAAGLHLLRGALNVLPDNKIVEDGHNAIRKDTKKSGSSKVRSHFRMQFALANSRVFDSRTMEHPAAVSKEAFVAAFAKTNVPKNAGRKFLPRHHQLPEDWARILGKSKTWQTLSETTLRKDIAAWNWLQNGYHSFAPTQGIKLDAALYSKLCISGVILKSLRGDRIYISLGSASWAVLLWDAVVLDVSAEGMHLVQPNPSGKAEFHHVVEPADWQVLPCVAIRTSGACIAFQQRMPADGLIKSCIASEKNGLFHADLLRLVAYLKLDASKRHSRLDLLRAIAMKVSEGDEAFMQQVLKLEKSDSVGTLSCLIDDPLVEVAYDELAEQDKVR